MAECLHHQVQDLFLKENPNITPIIERICEIAHPEKIIVFGSVSRGENNSTSDLDILIIKSGPYDPISLIGDIYVNLHGIKQSVDIVLCSPEDVAKSKNNQYSVLYPALKEGKIIYDTETTV